VQALRHLVLATALVALGFLERQTP